MARKASPLFTTSKPVTGLLTVGDELDTVFGADINDNLSRIAMGGPQKIVRIFDTATGEVAFRTEETHRLGLLCRIQPRRRLGRLG